MYPLVMTMRYLFCTKCDIHAGIPLGYDQGPIWRKNKVAKRSESILGYRNDALATVNQMRNLRWRHIQNWVKVPVWPRASVYIQWPHVIEGFQIPGCSVDQTGRSKMTYRLRRSSIYIYIFFFVPVLDFCFNNTRIHGFRRKCDRPNRNLSSLQKNWQISLG